MSADPHDLVPPDVQRELERLRREERMEQIRKKEAIRHALATEELVANAWKLERDL